MPTYQYIKGDPVPNARGYKLFKKENGVYNTDVDAQEIQQQLTIYGTIGSNGQPAESAFIYTMGGQPEKIIPITKLTENGYTYYIKVSGLMNIGSYEGDSSNVPFSGTLYLNYPNEVDFSCSEMGASNGAIHLRTNLGDIEIYNGINSGSIYSVGLSDGIVTVYGAHKAYRRTDFIPINSLTDHLRSYDFNPNNPHYYCAGAFTDDGNNMPGYKIAFYEGMSHSTFIKGLHWADFQETYINVDFLQGLVETEAPNAKYVIFSSSPTNQSVVGNDDFVTTGGIYFMLTGNNNLTGGEELAVQAIGDGVFFADSEKQTVDKNGNAIVYNPVS